MSQKDSAARLSLIPLQNEKKKYSSHLKGNRKLEPNLNDHVPEVQM